MARARKQIDQPEPRWQAVIALLVVGGVYLALPKELVVGPIWLLPAAITLLLLPTIFAHRSGLSSLNHYLGVAINGIITIALIASVTLLVVTLPKKHETPTALLCSAALLWISNIAVFALWYWRLDGGGPNEREEGKEFGSRSFLFPQMQIEKSQQTNYGIDHWRPYFIDYLFVSFTTSSTFGPTDAPLLARWAKALAIVQAAISLAIVVLLISRAVGVL